MKKLSLNKIALFGGAVLLAASASQAQSQQGVDYGWNSSTNGFPNMDTYYDYSKPAGSHSALPSFDNIISPNAASIGARYYHFGLSNNTTTGFCLEIVTSSASTTVAPDPKLWIRNLDKTLPDGTFAWVGLSDDADAIYHKFPMAHIWIQQNSSTNVNMGADLFLAAYSSSYNNQDLYYHISRLEGKTETSCTSGQTTYPWAKLHGTSMTTGNYK